MWVLEKKNQLIVNGYLHNEAKVKALKNVWGGGERDQRGSFPMNVKIFGLCCFLPQAEAASKMTFLSRGLCSPPSLSFPIISLIVGSYELTVMYNVLLLLWLVSSTKRGYFLSSYLFPTSRTNEWFPLSSWNCSPKGEMLLAFRSSSKIKEISVPSS